MSTPLSGSLLSSSHVPAPTQQTPSPSTATASIQPASLLSIDNNASQQISAKTTSISATRNPSSLSSTNTAAKTYLSTPSKSRSGASSTTKSFPDQQTSSILAASRSVSNSTTTALAISPDASLRNGTKLTQFSTTSVVLATTTTTSRIPNIMLASPTPLLNSNSGLIEEVEYVIALPFLMSIYAETNGSITITSNGLLSLGSSSNIIEAYTDNGGVAPANLYYGGVVAGTIFPWWQYMYSDGAPGRGIYYSVIHGSKSNTGWFGVEWNLLDQTGRPTHFLTSYNASTPGQIGLYYFTPGDRGMNSTIGAQGLAVDGSTQALQLAPVGGFVPPVNQGIIINTYPTNNGSWRAYSDYQASCFPLGTFPQGVCGIGAT